MIQAGSFGLAVVLPPVLVEVCGSRLRRQGLVATSGFCGIQSF